MIVDDDPGVRSIIKHVLEDDDYNVLLAHNAEDAMRMAERSDLRIDLMLVDVGMPDLAGPDLPDVGGPDLAERILASSTNLKVLFMSDGVPDAEMVRIKTRYRALGLLQKPFEIGTLLEKVNSALGHPVGALGPDDPDDGGIPDDGCASVTSPLLPRLPRRPPMSGKMPLPEY